MSPAFSRLIPDRRRATSFVLALVVEALIIIALLLWGPRIAPVQKSLRAPTSFSLLPSDDDRAATGCGGPVRIQSGYSTLGPPIRKVGRSVS